MITTGRIRTVRLIKLSTVINCYFQKIMCANKKEEGSASAGPGSCSGHRQPWGQRQSKATESRQQTERCGSGNRNKAVCCK